MTFSALSVTPLTSRQNTKSTRILNNVKDIWFSRKDTSSTKPAAPPVCWHCFPNDYLFNTRNSEFSWMSPEDRQRPTSHCIWMIYMFMMVRGAFFLFLSSRSIGPDSSFPPGDTCTSHNFYRPLQNDNENKLNQLIVEITNNLWTPRRSAGRTYNNYLMTPGWTSLNVLCSIF